MTRRSRYQTCFRAISPRNNRLLHAQENAFAHTQTGSQDLPEWLLFCNRIACVGNGDQKIFFDKAHDLVIVITAGNYNKWDIKKGAHGLLEDFIYPALFKKE